MILPDARTRKALAAAIALATLLSGCASLRERSLLRYMDTIYRCTDPIAPGECGD